MSVCDKEQTSNNEREKKHLGKRYNWEEANILIIKITANVIVISLLQTFRPSYGAIFNKQ